MTERLLHRLGLKPASMRWLLLGLAATTIVLVGVLVIPQWLLRWDGIRALTAANKAKAINDIRATLLQGVGGVALLFGAFFTYRQLQTGRDQLHVAQEGQVTERFTRAIDQLGHQEWTVRLGGIYALERIANDSRPDRTAITEVLTAFVRGHTPWPPKLPGQYVADAPIDQVPELQVWAPDAQAAVTVIGRRLPAPEPSRRLDFHACDLRKARLVGAQLQKADLRGVNLQGAFLWDAQLQEAELWGANLQGAILLRANLQGAILNDANLQRADLDEANLREAYIWYAQLQNATMKGAQLQRAHLFETQLQRAKLVSANLRESDLVGGNLQGAKLADANLQKARLAGTNLQKARLDGAQLQEAELWNVKLQGASLDNAQLNNAQADSLTEWPDGFDWQNAGVRISTSPEPGAGLDRAPA